MEYHVYLESFYSHSSPMLDASLYFGDLTLENIFLVYA